MEDINNFPLNNQSETNKVVSGISFISNNLQGLQGKIEENKNSCKYNLLIFIFNLDLQNQSLNNDSAPFHEFEHTSFNATKLIEELGEPTKESNTSKYNLLIFFI